MKRRGWMTVIVAVAVVAGFVVDAIMHREQMNPVSTWQTANPIIAPDHTVALTLGTTAQDRTQPQPLLPGHLANTDWYLPITQSSAVSYVLHDGQARWLVNGSYYPLSSAPTDPAGFLDYAPDGHMLAWQNGNTITVLTAPHLQHHQIDHAMTPYFTPSNHLDYLSVSDKTLNVQSTYPHRTLPSQALTGHHPFVFRGRDIVYDRDGQIALENLETAHVTTLATVRAKRWPLVVDSLSFGPSLAVMLERPTALPAYLIIVDTHGHISWYRWQTGLKPQIGQAGGHLVMNNVDPSGQLVVWGSHHLHPLPQSSGLFSQSPAGIIFQTSQGFIRLSSITP
ncbi:hypothetical protein [Sulfobacillus sp. hq2]|uniref:hypothetical protein n=1 Tax=Sulfobacillus TaxID=28033 RepID=UPI0011AF3510|nr:hypothetical protein [Sulfobacillus sp. hq2]